ncbi:hypothetical protein EWM64_g8995 [Hericium alpestre]|uniref:Peptidase S53 domain-containing protein n=1 Tax=Hericium alpestre TaxID=135208 RepID=A0A4Y9ZJN7_9AGAM|nr:hypothetical protein EWM64_g8995 [Hericium alpestre]
MARSLYVLGVFSLAVVYVAYQALSDSPEELSPQGCRMSRMLPSYILQSGLSVSDTPLAARYSLWLYREVAWEPTQPVGRPVLFIPGNAGSSHQVRSIASSAARQFYSTPYDPSPDFSARAISPLDVYALEFNEDFSALHAPTLRAQSAHAAHAINYILSLYPPNTSLAPLGASTVSAYFSALGSTNGGRFNRGGRAFPDISAQGDNVDIVFQQEFGLVGGTSCLSPIFASVVSLLNGELITAGKPPLGFLNPFLYSTGASALNDVTTGSNPGCSTNGFPARARWDPVTGLGTPNFAALRTAVGL